MGSVVLDARLGAIADMFECTKIYADIGCDHGRLGAYLLQHDRVQHAVLTDISEPSLQKARILIGNLGLDERVTFKVGDGAEALSEAVDAVVIAGMGGDTISSIVRNGIEKFGDAILFLQPNVGAPDVRRTLCECGYKITDERIALDGGRQYVIIRAEQGTESYTAEQLEVGPVLLKTLPPSLLPFARFRLRVAQKALEGARKGEDTEQIAALREQIDIWQSVLNDLKTKV